MSVILIYLLPGSVLALHQGIDHWRGAHVPHLIIFGWAMPFWLFYPLILLLGPVLLIAIFAQLLLGSRQP